jgi:probable F420-dependent oxidoreductase
VQIGAVFPQTEIGADPGAIAAFVDAVTDLGYRHLLAYDHVLGADPAVHPDWPGYYDLHDTFHEPLVLFSWLAGRTPIEFVTGILVAPQRETALLAKQTAELDVLSGGGRLRLGLGIGWNPVEYEALGQSFARRGARLEEQIVLLRRLWTEESVTFAGAFHTVNGAGIAPLPVTRPIPLWLGAMAPRALRRVGRLADGWFPQVAPGHGLEEAAEVVAAAAVEAGRDPAVLGMEGQARWSAADPERAARDAERWGRAGATHVSVNTMGAGCPTVDDHIAALATAAGQLSDAAAG